METTGSGASRLAALPILAAVILLAVLHFAVSVRTHPSHVIHVILGGLYLLPIIAGALWFGLAGGLLTALGVGASHLAHILVSWRNQPMENVNQFTMIGVYLLFGIVSGVRDDILFKPETLTPAERTRIERHPGIAAQILHRIHGARDIAEIVFCHHECPDGSGYPRGLRAEQIPLEARILRVADVYSALTDARSYKVASSPAKAIARMTELGEGKLDLESFRALRSLLDAAEHEPLRRNISART